MRPKHSGQSKASAERVVKDIRRATRRHFSAEDKIRIVLEGLRGDGQKRVGIAGTRAGALCAACLHPCFSAWAAYVRT